MEGALLGLLDGSMECIVVGPLLGKELGKLDGKRLG